MVEADTTIYAFCLCQIFVQNASIQYCTLYSPLQARLFCGDSDYFWDSAAHMRVVLFSTVKARREKVYR